MKMSESFIYTSKETPKDAELKSHQYLLRGGYIHQVGSGIYDLLPLGHRVLENVKRVIRKHLNASGALELSLGFVTPASLWQKSGRYEQYGRELLRFQDRKEQEFVLGPTYEEAIVECVHSYVKSYKQLPLNLYQIHLKFRDELRPRFGLIRGREFVMKDAYSFHASFEDLEREFAVMEASYRAIFDELGLDYAVVEADSGAIGGSGSKEFMLLADCGEDTLAFCRECGYASNVEVLEVAGKQSDLCPHCSQTLSHKKGIEVGHIFKLGTKYSEAMQATFLDKDGRAKPFEMGCYGIGVSRILSAFIEQNHDERGILWNEVLAPYSHYILVSNIKDEKQRQAGESLYRHLRSLGHPVLFDDRDERFGAKMSDFELLGIPWAFIIGKELGCGQVERVRRRGLQRELVAWDVLMGGEI